MATDDAGTPRDPSAIIARQFVKLHGGDVELRLTLFGSTSVILGFHGEGAQAHYHLSLAELLEIPSAIRELVKITHDAQEQSSLDDF